MTDWQDRRDIHPPVRRLADGKMSDGFAQICGLLVQDPIGHHITLGPRSNPYTALQVRFSLSTPSLQGEDQHCIAWGALAETICELKAGRRLKIVGTFQKATGVVSAQALGLKEEDANIT